MQFAPAQEGEGMANQLQVKLENAADIVGRLKDLKADSEKVIQSTMKDIASRAPSWVAQEVTKVYGIKKAEIKGSATKGSAGTVRLSGTVVDSYTLTYKGRVLTPTHFGMTPKARPAGGRKYTVKASIHKGEKKALGSKVFLAQSGGEGTTQIPFQRVGSARLPIKAVKTVSVPQMIDNEEVNAAIYERIGEEGIKRLNHHVDRYFSKK